MAAHGSDITSQPDSRYKNAEDDIKEDDMKGLAPLPKKQRVQMDVPSQANKLEGMKQQNEEYVLLLQLLLKDIARHYVGGNGAFTVAAKKVLARVRDVADKASWMEAVSRLRDNGLSEDIAAALAELGGGVQHTTASTARPLGRGASTDQIPGGAESSEAQLARTNAVQAKLIEDMRGELQALRAELKEVRAELKEVRAQNGELHKAGPSQVWRYANAQHEQLKTVAEAAMLQAAAAEDLCERLRAKRLAMEVPEGHLSGIARNYPGFRTAGNGQGQPVGLTVAEQGTANAGRNKLKTKDVERKAQNRLLRAENRAQEQRLAAEKANIAIELTPTKNSGMLKIVAPGLGGEPAWTGRWLGKHGTMGSYPDVQAIMSEWEDGICYLGQAKKTVPMRELEARMEDNGRKQIWREGPNMKNRISVMKFFINFVTSQASRNGTSTAQTARDLMDEGQQRKASAVESLVKAKAKPYRIQQVEGTSVMSFVKEIIMEKRKAVQ